MLKTKLNWSDPNLIKLAPYACFDLGETGSSPYIIFSLFLLPPLKIPSGQCTFLTTNLTFWEFLRFVKSIDSLMTFSKSNVFTIKVQIVQCATLISCPDLIFKFPDELESYDSNSGFIVQLSIVRLLKNQ